MLPDGAAGTQWECVCAGCAWCPWAGPAAGFADPTAAARRSSSQASHSGSPSPVVAGVKLRLMQPNLPQDAKFNGHNGEAILNQYLALSDELHRRLAARHGWSCLPSPPENVRLKNGRWLFSGHGSGHRVGFCMAD